MRSKETIGNVAISHVIVLFGVKVSLVFVILIYYFSCLTIALSVSPIVLLVCIIVFGILDQPIWILTTYTISCLYPVKTNLLIAACFTGISFSIFIWGNFAVHYINRNNMSLKFIFSGEVGPEPDTSQLIERFHSFFLYHSICLLFVLALVIAKFNIDETSKYDFRLFWRMFIYKFRHFFACCWRKTTQIQQKRQIAVPLLRNQKYQVIGRVSSSDNDVCRSHRWSLGSDTQILRLTSLSEPCARKICSG